MVDVYHYVNLDTENARVSLQWSKPNPSVPKEIDLVEGVLLVPDFYQFWPGYSSSAYLYVITDQEIELVIKSITIEAPDTKEELIVPLKLLTTTKRSKSSLSFSRDRILDLKSSNKFKEAKALIVTIEWRRSSDLISNRSVYELERISNTDIAWAT